MAHRDRIANRLVIVFVLVLCLGSTPGWAQQDDQQQMRGLYEQVQELKSDVLSIAEELSRLEEKLLFPSGTQVAVFVALAEGAQMRLDAVLLQIDGKLSSANVAELTKERRSIQGPLALEL